MGYIGTSGKHPRPHEFVWSVRLLSPNDAGQRGESKFNHLSVNSGSIGIESKFSTDRSGRIPDIDASETTRGQYSVAFRPNVV